MRIGAFAGGILLALIGLATARAHTDVEPGPPALSGLLRIIAAYPDYLQGIEGNELVWRDGTRMTLAALGIPERDDGPPPRLPNDPRQIISESISAVDYEPIYRRIYGDCRLGEVGPRLKPVRWLAGSPDGGSLVLMTRVNGVADALEAVSGELERLPAEFHSYLRPLGGTYSCRNILFSQRLSLHGFGIAIDINPAHADYWLWSAAGADGARIPRHRIPIEIVDIFERHGFVWGGRWNRFDTFHFEYRPEYALALDGVLPDHLTRARFAVASLLAPPTAMRPDATAPCFFRVRQPGPRFGQCLSAQRPGSAALTASAAVRLAPGQPRPPDANSSTP